MTEEQKETAMAYADMGMAELVKEIGRLLKDAEAEEKAAHQAMRQAYNKYSAIMDLDEEYFKAEAEYNEAYAKCENCRGATRAFELAYHRATGMYSVYKELVAELESGAPF